MTQSLGPRTAHALADALVAHALLPEGRRDDFVAWALDPLLPQFSLGQRVFEIGLDGGWRVVPPVAGVDQDLARLAGRDPRTRRGAGGDHP